MKTFLFLFAYSCVAWAAWDVSLERFILIIFGACAIYVIGALE